MKKIISFLLATAIMCFMSATVFAESPITTLNGTDRKDVTASYNSTENENVYSVDITWGGMQFEYKQPESTWDTVNHKWKVVSNDISSRWTVSNGSKNTINIKNNSSKAVNASFEFQQAQSYSNMTGEFKINGSVLSNDLNLEAPVENQVAKDYEVTFMPTAELKATTVSQSVIGIVTITIK